MHYSLNIICFTAYLIRFMFTLRGLSESSLIKTLGSKKANEARKITETKETTETNNTKLLLKTTETNDNKLLPKEIIPKDSIKIKIQTLKEFISETKNSFEY